MRNIIVRTRIAASNSINIRHAVKLCCPEKSRRLAMLVGVPREIKDNEFRVGMTPAVVTELVHHGHSVLVETSSGLGSGLTDEEYRAAGATIVAGASEIFARADMVVKVK